MTTYKRVWPETRLNPDGEYAVMARYKGGLFDDAGESFVKLRGTYDECDEYADRNESPDNRESYYVAEVIT